MFSHGGIHEEKWLRFLRAIGPLLAGLTGAGRNYKGTKGWKFFMGASMTNTEDRQHRSIVQRIARQAITELNGIQGAAVRVEAST